jgi:Fe2+ transport system protein FeoA
MNIKKGDKIRITGFSCGGTCQHRFSCMGMIIDREFIIKEIQPFHGPIVVNLNGTEFTIGRGMFEKLDYEVIR